MILSTYVQLDIIEGTIMIFHDFWSHAKKSNPKYNCKSRKNCSDISAALFLT